MTTLLDPRNDFVFKRIFGHEDNKDVLLAFLNCIFAESGDAPLSEIILMNPYTDKDAPLDKQSIFDIWVKTSKGKLIDIEMQWHNNYDIEKRTLFYWAKRYSSQLQEGQTYRELRKCVTINILNFSITRSEGCHHIFHMREEQTGERLIDDIEIHVLELSKQDGSYVPQTSGLANWMLFLKNENISNWEALTMNEPKLEKAIEALKYLSQDEEARRLYEARQKYLHDEASKMEWYAERERFGHEQGLKKGLQEGLEQGLERGLEQGRQEGEREKAVEIARNLLAIGVDRAIVVKASGLSEEEVASLQPD